MNDYKEELGTKASLSRRGKYRRHSEEEKRRIVAETYAPGASVAVVARRNEVNANQVFNWRRQHRKESLVFPAPGSATLMPVGVIAPPAEIAPELGALAPRTSSAPHAAPKLIEIELACGAKIRIDGDVRMPVLQSVLKLARGLA